MNIVQYHAAKRSLDLNRERGPRKMIRMVTTNRGPLDALDALTTEVKQSKTT